MIALPDAAASKLFALEGQRDSEEDTFRGAVARLNGFDPRGDQKVKERITSNRDLARARFENLAALTSKIKQFISALPGDVVIEPAPAMNIKPRADENLPQAVARVRGSLLAAKNHLAIVRSAGAPKSELMDSVRAFVEKLGQRGRPQIVTDRGALSVSFADPRSDAWAGRDDVASILCWACPQVMVDAIAAALPESKTAMSAKEKTERVAQLTADIERLEREDEALVLQAEESNQAIARRVDAWPPAVLSFVVKQKVQAQAA